MGNRKGTPSRNSTYRGIERVGIAPPVEDDTWRQSARCAQVDPDLWHPEKSGGSGSRKAVSICRDVCAVRQECLSYCLRVGEHNGIYGGFSPRSRQPFHAMVGAGASPSEVATTAIVGTEVMRRWSA